MDRKTLETLQDLLSQKSDAAYQPVFFDLDNESDCQTLENLKITGQISQTVDSIPEALEDLFRIHQPYIGQTTPEYKKSLQKYTELYANGHDLLEKGVWAYFPWRKTLVHLPNKDDYYILRTARNKFLIETDEQDAFYNARIGLAGLSVGSSVLQAITLSGGSSKMRIADLDTLSITNLNRLPGSVCDLTTAKSLMAARKVYELDPFSELEVFPNGLDENNFDEFFVNNGKIDLFIEEMDNIRMKIVSRFKARELGIPVVMATDNGDNTMIDVERFDLEPDRPLFHGKVDEEKLRNTAHELNLADRVKLANAIVGPDVTYRMQRSLTLVGSQLPAWPQLGNAALLSGVAVSYIARRIVNGQPMPSGRYEVHLDSLLDEEYHSNEANLYRAEQKEEFINGFNLLYAEEEHD